MADSHENSGGILLSGTAAAVSLLAASSCCLPVLPFAIAAGMAGVSLALASLRPLLLAASVLSIGLGFVLARRAKRCNRRWHVLSLALLWFAAAVVAVSLLFPQLLANLLAG